MRSLKLSSSSLLVPIFLTPLAYAQGCRNFTQIGDSYTKPANNVHIVSTGAVCPDICSLTSGGAVEQASELNITVTANTETILSVVGGGDPSYLSRIGYLRSNYTLTLEDGQAGWIGFTVTMTCVEGILCVDEYGVKEDTPIEACHGNYLGDVSDKALDGSLHFVTTDKESARSLGRNPAADFEDELNRGQGNDDQPPGGGATGLKTSWMAGLFTTLVFIVLNRFV